MFSPISITVLAIALVTVFGNGCMDTRTVQTSLMDGVSASREKQTNIPILDILEPKLTTSTTAQSMLIKGETDQEKVFVANKRVDVTDKEFTARVDLKKGLNIMLVEAGNGLTTTTISLQITRNHYE